MPRTRPGVRTAQCGRAAAGLLLLFIPISASALDIALSNDDGWSATGIQKMYEALVAAGHHVTLAAPAGQQSGSSAAADSHELRIRREKDDQFSVSVCLDKECSSLQPAKPATSARMAIDIATRRAGHPPALLISGINQGSNTGASTQFSGTVGAAIASIAGSFQVQVPAIAISTDPPAACKGDEACADRHYEETAQFMVELVRRLDAKAANRSMLPPDVALNVNYPTVPPKGVRVAVQGRALIYRGEKISISAGCADCPGLATGESARGGILEVSRQPVADVADSDGILMDEGYVTIVPISADYTARGDAGLDWINQWKVVSARDAVSNSH